MADSRDITGKNRKFKGTDSITLPKGSQAQRVGGESGELRFNTDTNLAEYYDGTEWKPIDAPPTITSASPASPVDDGATTTTITITGSNLQSGGTLTLIGNDATSYNVSSFTRVSSSSITFSYTSALAAAGVNTPYDIRYENPSGLAAVLEDGFTPNVGPVFGAAAGSLGTINIGANATTLTQPNVTDAAGGTLVVSVASGSLPGGVSMNTSTGALSGVTNASGTFSFTLSATDGTTTVTRAYTATVVNPYVAASGGTETTSGDYKIHTFTSPGTFTVSSAGTPSGSDTVEYLVVAGGGGGGADQSGTGGGGGGGGGFRTNFPSPVTGGLSVPAQAYPISVGGSGAGSNAVGTRGGNGGNSTFSNITSAGGGGGGSNPNSPGTKGADGGSGGGSTHYAPYPAGSGNVPPVSPPQGNPGGDNQGRGGPHYGSGGGGGAGSSGGNGTQNNGGRGGNGTTSNISGSPVTFSGGGGGGIWTSAPGGDYGRGGSGGGGDAGSQPGSGNNGQAGTNGIGGGGGGCSAYPGAVRNGGNGGSGRVVIRYKFQ